MKKLLVLSLISVLLLVGCEKENKQTNTNTPSNPTSNQTDNTAETKITKKGDTYTDEQLIELIKKYREENKLYNPKIFEVTAYNGNIVTIQVDDDMGDHLATSDWYYIDNRDGSGENFFGEHIQLVK